MLTRDEIIEEYVRSMLKADGIDELDNESAIKSLSECVAAKSCIRVYIERIYSGKLEFKEFRQKLAQS